jgi:hypothetical protein
MRSIDLALDSVRMAGIPPYGRDFGEGQTDGALSFSSSFSRRLAATV